MGNLISCYNEKKNIEEDEELYTLPDIENFIHKYNCSIIQCTSNLIKKNQKYNLYLCDNDIIIKNRQNTFTFIYNNILHWTFSKHFFGFTYKNSTTVEDIVIKVNNGNKVAENLKKIVYELVDYYKNI